MVHGKMHEGPNGGGLSRKAILSEIDKSLQRQDTYAVAFKVLGRHGGCEWLGSPKGFYLEQVNSSALMKTPERTTAEVFPRYLGGEVVSDSATLKWPGLFVRRYRFPRVVDYGASSKSRSKSATQVQAILPRSFGGSWV